MSQEPQAVLGATIRKLRLAADLTLEALAERAELHWTYLSGIERGRRNVSLVNIVKIAHALKVRPSRLLKNVD